jgi:hypothetical protein
MYSGDIKRRNPPATSAGNHASDEFHASDPYAPNPLKPAFQQQQHHPSHREHPSHRVPARREYSSNKVLPRAVCIQYIGDGKI